MMENGKTAYTVVYAANANANITADAAALCRSIKSFTGVDVASTTDSTAEGQYEVLIGATNRPESVQAMQALPTHGYSITRNGDKLVIVATDDSLLAMALIRFEMDVLRQGSCCGEGYLRISDAAVLREDRQSALSVGEMLKSSGKMTASTEFVLHGEQYTQKIRIAQGAASDGKYVYFSVRRAGADSVGGVIYKYDLETHEKIAVSEELAFGHGNDLTFDTKHNRLIVAHGLKENHYLTIVDPETLAVIEKVEIGPSGSSISYNPWLDCYAMGEGYKIDFMDANFNLIKSVTRKDYDQQGYVNQGMGSDQHYIYLPLSYSDKTKNLIAVFDWEGNQVKEIPLPEEHESESFFVVGDDYYITFYHNGKDAGTYLHKVSFTLTYTAATK